MSNITFLLKVMNTLRAKRYGMTLSLTYFNEHSDHRAFAVIKITSWIATDRVCYLELHQAGEGFQLELYNFKPGTSDIAMHHRFPTIDGMIAFMELPSWNSPGVAQNRFDDSIKAPMLLLERLGDALNESGINFNWGIDTFMSHEFVVVTHDLTGVPMGLLGPNNGSFAVPATKNFVHFNALNIWVEIDRLYVAEICYRLNRDGSPSSFRLFDSHSVKLRGDFSDSLKFNLENAPMQYVIDDAVIPAFFNLYDTFKGGK